jgi:hypothetical protein
LRGVEGRRISAREAQATGGATVSDETKAGTKITVGSRPEMPLWCIGWLFTIGYLKLTFWKAVFALIIWPCYIGLAVR